MSGDAVPQIFVRNDKGQTWGPLALTTVSKLIETGQIPGRILVSEDGVHFAFPVRFPHLRQAFPRELWGNPSPNGATPQAPGPQRPVAPQSAAEPTPERSAAPVLTPSPMPASSSAPILTPSPVAASAAQAASPAAAARAAAASSSSARAAAPPSASASARAAASSPAPASASAPASAADPAESFSIASETLPASGDLAKISPVRLYAVAALKQLTGHLSLKLADGVIDVYFRKGNPELVESTHPDDALDTFLLSQKLVDKERLATAKQAGGELVSTLFAQGLLQPATAFAHLLRRSTFILYRGLYASAGFFTFKEEAFPAHKAMPLGHRWGLLVDFVRKIPAPELKHRMRAEVDRAMLKSTGAIDVHDLKLTPQETRALGGIDGIRSLAQLCAESPQDAETFLRLAYLLKELELVSFNRPAQPRPADAQGRSTSAATADAAAPKTAAVSDSRQSATAPPPSTANVVFTTPAAAASPEPAGAPASASAAPTPRPVAAGRPASPSRPAIATPSPRPQASPPSAPAQKAASQPTPAPVDVAELKSLLAKMKEQTHFERLGVTEKADATAVKMAYFKLARLYHPDTVSPDAGPVVMKLNEDLFAAIGEAYRVLIDPAARANYEEELKSGAGEFDIQQLLAAEEHFHKATLLVKGKRFEEALKLLDEAVQMNPEEGEFYAWRGYARFFVTPDKKVALAAANKDLTTALKKNEKCAIAWFYLGQLAKLTGDTATALKHFKSTLELQPHHIDAQREVRLLTKK